MPTPTQWMGAKANLKGTNAVPSCLEKHTQTEWRTLPSLVAKQTHTHNCSSKESDEIPNQQVCQKEGEKMDEIEIWPFGWKTVTVGQGWPKTSLSQLYHCYIRTGVMGIFLSQL